MNSLGRAAAAVIVLVALSACKSDSGPKAPGSVAQFALSGAAPTPPANTLVTTLQIQLQDASGTPVPNQAVTFTVAGGGGSITTTTGTSDASGNVTIPSWRVGKSDLLQELQVSAGSKVLGKVQLNIATQYKIVVRFWGPTMTGAQQQLFTDAGARLQGIIVGDVVDADARGQNLDLNSNCNVSGQPPLNELIDDIIIYASIQDIDGPGKVLARSGPCLTRTATANSDRLPAVGVMEFDSADLQTLQGSGSLIEVITHEMLHVLGYGTIWNDGQGRMLLTAPSTADPRFTGLQATAACKSYGATITCANSVPVEGTPAPAGTIDSHWRESTFQNELMTGYINSSPNPISSITIGSMADVGYTVNMADTDSYTFPGAALRSLSAGGASAGLSAPTHAGWEVMLPVRGLITPDGRVIKVIK